MRAPVNDFTARFSRAIQGAVLVTSNGKFETKLFTTLSHPIILVRAGRGTAYLRRYHTHSYWCVQGVALASGTRERRGTARGTRPLAAALIS